MARTREMSSILGALGALRPIGDGYIHARPARAPIADAAFVDQSSAGVERRGTADDHSLPAAQDLAAVENDEIAQHRAERERRAGLDPEAAHPDVQNRVTLTPATFDLDETEREGHVGRRRQPRRPGRTPGGRGVHDQLRAGVASRSEHASYEELVSPVGEIDHRARGNRRAAGYRAEGEDEISTVAGHPNHERLAPGVLAADPQRGRCHPSTETLKKPDVHGARIFNSGSVYCGALFYVAVLWGGLRHC